MVCEQLRLVLWKNWILKKRRCSGTLLEIAIPVLAIALLILLRWLLKVEDQPQNLLVDEARRVTIPYHTIPYHTIPYHTHYHYQSLSSLLSEWVAPQMDDVA
jgi:hypothetical protein